MNKNKKLYIIIAILGALMLVSGISYAILTVVVQGIEENVIRFGSLDLTLTETNAITIDNAIPVTDEEGMSGTPMSFSLTNNSSIEVGYVIYLDESALSDGETRVEANKLRFEMKKEGVSANMDNLQTLSTKLFVGIIAPNETVNYELRLWVDYDTTTILNTDVFRGKLRVVGTQGLPDIDPNPPELVGDMIPVTWNGTDWVKANPLSWYNYSDLQWANAVTVTAPNRATLVDSEVGTVIPMTDINAMFVWIPRYSYTIGNTYGYQIQGGDFPDQDTPGAIDIRFIDKTMTELGTAAYTGEEATNWYTSPAFCWGQTCDDPATREDAGNEELPGIWVAKFETSTTGNTTSDTIQQPIVKPTVTSWRSVTLSNMFYSVQQYMNLNNGLTLYGLEGNYDAHMMKNTEWGAVAYLSQSKYGKYNNDDYIGIEKEVAINNCINYITGIGGDTVSASQTTASCSTNTYETEKGQTASTTGNIYGVYDISGGAYEYVMGNMEDSSNAFDAESSGFTTPPDKKYYNSYTYNTNVTTGRILGDATGETAGFYGDIQSFANYSTPWFLRGGYYGSTTVAGVFNFYNGNGNDGSSFGFRVSITP